MAVLKVNIPKPEPKKRGGKRDTVLVSMTVAELREKVGDEATVMVGRKHLGKLLARSLG
jgi:hypothetical protein